MDNSQYTLTREDIATIFKVHPQTVRNLVLKGDIPFIKIGTQYRFNLQEVETALRGKNDKL